MEEMYDEEVVKLNDRLYQRVTDELSAYRESLREMKVDDILGNAYKYIICCDIQCELEFTQLSKEKAQALLDCKHPLEAIYDEWLSRDFSYMEEISNVIDQTASARINAKKLSEQADRALKRDDAR